MKATTIEEFVGWLIDYQPWITMLGMADYVIGPLPTAPTDPTDLRKHREDITLGLRYLCAAISSPHLVASIIGAASGEGPNGFAFLQREFLRRL